MSEDDYQQPEDDGSLEFWMWCEEQAESEAEGEEKTEEVKDVGVVAEEPPF